MNRRRLKGAGAALLIVMGSGCASAMDAEIPSPSVEAGADQLATNPIPTNHRCDALPRMPHADGGWVRVHFQCGSYGADVPTVPTYRPVDENASKDERFAAAMQAFVGGPTPEEAQWGLWTPLPREARAAVVAASLDGDVARVSIEFDFARVSNLSTSNLSGAWLRMLYATALEFQHLRVLDMSGLCDVGLGDISCDELTRADLVGVVDS